jgi:hypothetical protein
MEDVRIIDFPALKAEVIVNYGVVLMASDTNAAIDHFSKAAKQTDNLE